MHNHELSDRGMKFRSSFAGSSFPCALSLIYILYILSSHIRSVYSIQVLFFLDFEWNLNNGFLFYCSPCIVGNLWDVTDRDIDRYLESLLKTWFSGNTNDLMDTRQSSRLACRFKYLIGAAPVVYGFPVHMKRNQ